MCEISQVTYISVIPIKGYVIPWHAGMLFTYKLNQFLLN